MATNVVGARELKARLGAYLRQVRQGRRLIVTDRGNPVAELRPIETGGDTRAVLEKLKVLGVVTQAREQPLAPFRPVESRGAEAAAAVREDRDDRF